MPRKDPFTIGVLVFGIALVLFSLTTPSFAGEKIVSEKVTIDGVLHIRNGAAPSHGKEILKLSEVWRVNGYNEEVLIGTIGEVISDADGNVYLLDLQLAEVKVFSPEGEYLKTLSREGEGPGEIRRPGDMLFLPDGTLGIVQRFPGKIIKVELDGTPAGSFTPGGDNPTEGGFSSVNKVEQRAGLLVASGAVRVRTDNGSINTRYLASFDETGKEQHRYLEKVLERDFRAMKFSEKKEDYLNGSRWALGPDGTVYVAPIWDDYTIQAYSPDGALQKVIEREFQSWKRTGEEKDRVRSSVRRFRHRRPVEIEYEIEDFDPAIQRLYVDDEGFLWILNSRSHREQEDNIFQTYDLFDLSGDFVRQVSISCEGDGVKDRLFRIGKDRFVLIKGYADAVLALRGSGPEQEEEEVEEEPEPLEIIYYRVDNS